MNDGNYLETRFFEVSTKCPSCGLVMNIDIGKGYKYPYDFPIKDIMNCKDCGLEFENEVTIDIKVTTERLIAKENNNAYIN